MVLTNFFSHILTLTTKVIVTHVNRHIVTSPTAAEAKYCNELVCVSLCVCLSVCEHISQTTRVIFIKFLCVAYSRGSVLIRRGDAIPREGAVLGVFFPINNALYSIAFWTHTKTTEPIQILFALMTLVGPRYHMLDGGLNSPGKGQFLGEM